MLNNWNRMKNNRRFQEWSTLQSLMAWEHTHNTVMSEKQVTKLYVKYDPNFKN